MVKRVMVDFDNTLVDFTRMFFKYIKDEFDIDIDKNENRDYDLSVILKEKGLDDEIIRKIFDKLWKERNFYQKYLEFLDTYTKTLTIIKRLKEKGYVPILITKVPSLEMAISKIKFFRSWKYKNLFDDIRTEIVADKNIVKSTKDTDYNIIIDDSPYIVENYCKNNEKGIVYMPVTSYNSFLLSKYPNQIRGIKNENC